MKNCINKISKKKHGKLIKNKETAKPLVKKMKDEDAAAKSSESTEEPEHTSVYLKRDALYQNMKNLNISVESSSTVDVILDFLKNKIVSKDQVRNLNKQNKAVSSSQRVADILEKARREFDGDEDEEESSRIQSMLEQITIETLNESGQYAGMNKKEKLMLFNEFESLLGLRSPGMNLEAPPPMSKPNFIIFTEPKKKTNEEEKRLLMEEEKERKDKDHHDSSSTDQDKSMNFFGKFSKMVTDKSMSFRQHIRYKCYSDELEAEGEESEEDSLKKHGNELEEKIIDFPERKRSSKVKEKEESDIEETIETSNKNNMDIPIELGDLQESEDVVYEFYYNRTKIPNTRTIYELINYQPSHRQITDQYIIYYRILDRSEISDDSSNTQEEPSEDEEIAETLTKEKELMKTIRENSSVFSPVISEFMQKHISPYVKPDYKQKSAQNTNRYSFAPSAMNSGSTKIGVSEDEQRLISKKSRKI